MEQEKSSENKLNQKVNEELTISHHNTLQSFPSSMNFNFNQLIHHSHFNPHDKIRQTKFADLINEIIPLLLTCKKSIFFLSFSDYLLRAIKCWQKKGYQHLLSLLSFLSLFPACCSLAILCYTFSGQSLENTDIILLTSWRVLLHLLQEF